MITITNGKLTAKIAEMGAELRALEKDGVSYLWSGDPQWWTSTAPLMFPICGGLLDDKFVWQGKEYTLPKHGFARKLPFTVEKVCADSAVFLLTDNEKTRAMYPFAFALRVTFTLDGEALRIDWDVENKSATEMPYSIGGHEAYACPEGIEHYDIVFDEPVTLNAHVLDGNIMTPETYTVLENGTVFPLKESYFSVDALTFRDITWGAATLRNRETGRGIRSEFAGFPNMFIWQKYQAPYVCIEPWHGIPDGPDSDRRLEHKSGIRVLAPGETQRTTHVLTPIAAK